MNGEIRAAGALTRLFLAIDPAKAIGIVRVAPLANLHPLLFGALLVVGAIAFWLTHYHHHRRTQHEHSRPHARCN
jgi:hypothetical protein